MILGNYFHYCVDFYFFMLKGNKLCSLKLAKDSTFQTSTGNIMNM